MLLSCTQAWQLFLLNSFNFCRKEKRQKKNTKPKRRDGWVVESGWLLIRCTRFLRTEGSNPSLSETLDFFSIFHFFLLFFFCCKLFLFLLQTFSFFYLPFDKRRQFFSLEFHSKKKTIKKGAQAKRFLSKQLRLIEIKKSTTIFFAFSYFYAFFFLLHFFAKKWEKAAKQKSEEKKWNFSFKIFVQMALDQAKLHRVKDFAMVFKGDKSLVLELLTQKRKKDFLNIHKYSNLLYFSFFFSDLFCIFQWSFTLFFFFIFCFAAFFLLHFTLFFFFIFCKAKNDKKQQSKKW